MQLVKAPHTCHIFAQSCVFLISMHAGIIMNNVCLRENNKWNTLSKNSELIEGHVAQFHDWLRNICFVLEMIFYKYNDLTIFLVSFNVRFGINPNKM